MTRDEWIALLATELAVEPPTSEDIETLLELAGTAAHASERQAAPLSCWLVGVAGVSPAVALEMVRRLAD